MKKTLLIAAMAFAATTAWAIPVNNVLKLEPHGSVNCGTVEKMAGLESYTLQLWFNPSNWSANAPLLKMGNDLCLELGTPGHLTYRVGQQSIDIAADAFKAGSWAQLTIVSDSGSGTVLVNGSKLAQTYTLPALPFTLGELTIGGGFEGRIDDLRLWSGILAPDFDYFVNNTLNRWNPQLDILAAYYKFDQADCREIVEQTAIWKNDPDAANNHGEPSASGVSKEPLTDNAAMKYRLNAGYTDNGRFFDRGIEADQYLLSNEIIILGIDSKPDGHLQYTTPCDNATLKGSAKWLDSYEGRTGVVSFDGKGTMECGSAIFCPTTYSYTLEMFVYIDSWTEGATILSKESADGTKGFALRLGAEADNVLDVTVNGHHYRALNKIETGKWTHIALWPNANPRDARTNVYFCIDGTIQYASTKNSDKELVSLPAGAEDEILTVGKDFIGKIDEFCVWSTSLTTDQVKNHIAKGPSMPGFGIVQTAQFMRSGEAAYLFDKQDNPGFDSYSQDNWRDIMKAAYNGTKGYEMRISVRSHDGWQNTIADAAKRKIFAADLAKLSEGYDGVELDLEWMYGTQTTLGLLAEEIRKALPEGKSFNISCHNVAYGFPVGQMGNVDGFTFQQYGPSKDHFAFSQFSRMCDNFVSYGFPADKIIASYSTTTSRGHINGQGDPAHEIKGVRNGFLDDYTPDAGKDTDIRAIDGYNYYFCSPLQVYRRARRVCDSGFQGIFYWDMGNDVPVSHKYNMARWCSYALNSNIEPYLTKVEIKRSSGVENITVPEKGNIGMAIINNGTSIKTSGIDARRLDAYTIAGARAASAEGNTLGIAALLPGAYILTATLADGSRRSAKFVK